MRAYAMLQRPSGIDCMFPLNESSQEPLGQFQSNLIGNMLGGW